MAKKPTPKKPAPKPSGSGDRRGHASGSAQPALRLTLRHKESGERVDLAAFWTRDGRPGDFGGKIATARGEYRGVEAIKLTDGTVIRNFAEWWVNLDRPFARTGADETPAGGGDDGDDIPF